MAEFLTKARYPHIQNVTAGREKYDPMHNSIFEVAFEGFPNGFPADLKTEENLLVLTEQVTEVSGLDALQKTVQAGSQKFMGVDVSFLNPTLDNTYAELTITFNLNLRNATDAYVLKIFKAWEKLGYDLTNGTRTLMKDYCADNLRIAVANRDGSIWRSVVFHKVLLTGVTNLDTLVYTSNDACTLQCAFRADWWDEELE